MQLYHRVSVKGREAFVVVCEGRLNHHSKQCQVSIVVDSVRIVASLRHASTRPSRDDDRHRVVVLLRCVRDEN